MKRLLVLVLLCASATHAAAAPSPTAILDAYAKAIGGTKAWAQHKNLRITRTLEAKGMQIRGTEERTAMPGGKMLSVTTIEGVGSMKQGADGKVRWTEDPINGLRVLQG